ncbi:MAG: DUF3592 domain-containing protein [Gracilimonas sp.]|uniref:DUF3592 domain-containing protein n=2 Tax=Balneolaceae TaxID=1813606 RepID=UPI001B16F8D0|nr:DUF3592 domain-containing protein [Gracilimonas sp.]MBO6586929.1 DUF3592 domain-containing protein [Gracilimonas sp.]MBO6614583.1 DUF3592 domain-containing protein [Gracilimonas sp.]
MMNLPLLVGIAFTLFGVYLVIHAVRNHRRAKQSEDWPVANGKLVSVELWGKRNIDGEMKDAEKLSVKYEYILKGKVYESSTVAFYTMMYPETIEFAENNSPDQAVDVYYNPAKPNESVLIPGLRSGNKRYSDLILALFAVFIGIVVAIMS